MNVTLIRQRSLQNFNLREVGIFLAFLVLVGGFSIASPYFFDVENLLNIVRQVSLTGIMAVGMTMVIVTGEIDLSISSTYGLAAIVTGLAMNHNFPIALSILLGLLSGVIVGSLNGVLVTHARIPSIIVTLGTLNIARGASMLITNGIPVTVSKRTVSNPNLDSFLYLGQGKLLDIVPVMAVFFLISALVGFIVFHKSLVGFHMRAVGGNSNAAKACGISVSKIKLIAFVITGLLAAFAGILNIAFITNVRADSGAGLELTVISAVILGGTSMAGGEGTILGTIIGVLIIGVLKNGLILLGISPFWQLPIIGAVIIAAVGVDMWLRRRRA